MMLLAFIKRRHAGSNSSGGTTADAIPTPPQRPPQQPITIEPVKSGDSSKPEAGGIKCDTEMLPKPTSKASQPEADKNANPPPQIQTGTPILSNTDASMSQQPQHHYGYSPYSMSTQSMYQQQSPYALQQSSTLPPATNMMTTQQQQTTAQQSNPSARDPQQQLPNQTPGGSPPGPANVILTTAVDGIDRLSDEIIRGIATQIAIELLGSEPHNNKAVASVIEIDGTVLMRVCNLSRITEKNMSLAQWSLSSEYMECVRSVDYDVKHRSINIVLAALYPRRTEPAAEVTELGTPESDVDSDAEMDTHAPAASSGPNAAASSVNQNSGKRDDSARNPQGQTYNAGIGIPIEHPPKPANAMRAVPVRPPRVPAWTLPTVSLEDRANSQEAAAAIQNQQPMILSAPVSARAPEPTHSSFLSRIFGGSSAPAPNLPNPTPQPPTPSGGPNMPIVDREEESLKPCLAYVARHVTRISSLAATQRDLLVTRAERFKSRRPPHNYCTVNISGILMFDRRLLCPGMWEDGIPSSFRNGFTVHFDAEKEELVIRIGQPAQVKSLCERLLKREFGIGTAGDEDAEDERGPKKRRKSGRDDGEPGDSDSDPDIRTEMSKKRRRL